MPRTCSAPAAVVVVLASYAAAFAAVWALAGYLFDRLTR